MTVVTESPTTSETEMNPKKAVPVLLFLFVFSLVIDSAFRFTSKPIADALGLSVTTVSLQATLGGIIIGVGAVVYATLADAIDMRKLITIAIGFMCAGSVLAFAFQTSWPMILTGRVVQTAGLAAAETLYVIFVTKYLPREEQRRYLGFSTSAFQISLLIGTLASGFISTYLSWTALFLMPLLSILALPVVLKNIPKQRLTGARLDILGLLLVTVIATCVMLFLQAFTWWYLLPVVIAAALFWWHISTHSNALVDRSFFSDGPYLSALVVVFLLYSVQLAYLFMFPFFISAVYGWTIDNVSLMMVPGYLCAFAVGAQSGRIAKRMSAKSVITLAMVLIASSMLLPGMFVTTSVVPFVLSMMVFGGGFALMYAPLVATAIRNIPAEKTGVAIGFYNLMINIAVSIGIAVTAKLIDAKPTFLSGIIMAPAGPAMEFANIILIISAIALVGLAFYRIAFGILDRGGRGLGKSHVDA